MHRHHHHHRDTSPRPRRATDPSFLAPPRTLPPRRRPSPPQPPGRGTPPAARSWPGCWPGPGAPRRRSPALAPWSGEGDRESAPLWEPPRHQARSYKKKAATAFVVASPFHVSLYPGTCTGNLDAVATYTGRKLFCERSFPRTTAPALLTGPVMLNSSLEADSLSSKLHQTSSKRCKLFQCTSVKFHYKVNLKQSLCITVNFQTAYKGQKHESACSLTICTKHLLCLLSSGPKRTL